MIEEQAKFQYYLRNIERFKDHARWLSQRRVDINDEEDDAPMWKNATSPPRLDSLLIANQLKQYCLEINRYSAFVLSKLQLEVTCCKRA